MKVVAQIFMQEGKFLKNIKNKLRFTSKFFNISFDHHFVSQKSKRMHCLLVMVKLLALRCVMTNSSCEDPTDILLSNN